MITWLEIRGYRSFEHYRLDGLTRINLIIGKSNSGKSSVLEVLYLHDEYQRVETTLGLIAEARGEANRTRDNGLRFELRNFLFGHSFDSKGEMQIKSNIESISWKDRSFLFRDIKSRDLSISQNSYIAPKSIFISPANPLSFEKMAKAWNKIVLEGRENEVLELMRIHDENLDSVYFLGNQSSRGDIVVGHQGKKARHPIGSQGEGLQRLLGLSLAIIDAENKDLLVDEIETGLHYSLMPKLWMALEKAVTKNNVQIFATTHSYDVIRGLASALEERPELGELISVHKLDRRLDHSVRLDADELRAAIKQEIEIR